MVLLLLELSVLSFLLSLTMVISLRILASCAVIFISSVLFNVDTIANEMFEVKNSTDGRTQNTPPNFRFCAQLNALEKYFKICHIYGTKCSNFGYFTVGLNVDIDSFFELAELMVKMG